MLAFPEMLVDPAVKAGIKVPEDIEKYNPKDFPHWEVFCNAQLGVAMPTPYCQWENAQVIATIPENEIMKVTHQDLLNLGFQVGFPIP